MKYYIEDYELESFFGSNGSFRTNEVIFSGEGLAIIEDTAFTRDQSIYSLDTRLDNYNYSVYDTYWSFFYDDTVAYIEEINKDDYFIVSHYKGKHFYIYETAKLRSYNEKEDHYTYYIPDNKDKRDQLKKIISCLEGELLNNEIKGLIHNELKIGGYSCGCGGAEYYTSLKFNIDLLNKLYDDDLYECSNDMLDFVAFKDINQKNYKNRVLAAYKALLHYKWISKRDTFKKKIIKRENIANHVLIGE